VAESGTDCWANVRHPNHARLAQTNGTRCSPTQDGLSAVVCAPASMVSRVTPELPLDCGIFAFL
jgi:hypothetical protein